MDPSFIRCLKANKNGKAVGVTSVCSANRFALEAAALQAGNDGSVLLIESTSSQVNPFGGYAGFTPRTFARHVRDTLGTLSFPRERLVLGGDHLGPYPWREEKSDRAMKKAADLVRACVEAGFVKVHLDASMACADDSPFGDVLPPSVSAERAADLCLAAEGAYLAVRKKQPPPLYVIGSDVPEPGGRTGSKSGADISTVRDVETTVRLTREAFFKRRLQAAWERTVALVVRPGVEFGNDAVLAYSSGRAKRLSEYIARDDRLVYEAHSTDFQRKEGLRQMVRDHFAILKVGPWLTFAFREAVFALAAMEDEWLSGKKSAVTSKIRRTLQTAMRQNPVHWEPYYRGNRLDVAFACDYSLSDRCRYYWPVPSVQRALSRLIQNLTASPVPHALLSQYMPVQHAAVREGTLPNRPADLIRSKIMEVTAIYADACGTRASSHPSPQ